MILRNTNSPCAPRITMGTSWYIATIHTIVYRVPNKMSFN